MSLEHAAGDPLDDLALEDQRDDENRYRREDDHRIIAEDTDALEMPPFVMRRTLDRGESEGERQDLASHSC